MKNELLSRDAFRQSVFERDGFKCVVCGRNDLPLDAHHIIERRLWDDGGYYLANGATLCDDGVNGCHYQAEQTKISVYDIIEKIGLKRPLLPDTMYDDLVYDKWGNTILENGKRTKGPLFNDESVQEVLKWCLNEFTTYVKYHRTYHAPWSLGINDDDKVIKDISNFVGKRVIVTEKMDGENFTVYQDYCHARSVDSKNHYTRNWAKNFAMNYISPNLPDGWRMCLENMYAVHSIKYNDLDSYLLAFSLWDDKNVCLSWDETLEYFELIGVKSVKVLYDGVYDECKIKKLYDEKMYDTCEGYVIRLADSFHYKDFHKSVMKFVRSGHVQTSKHWMYGYGKTHDLNGIKNE